MGETGKTRGSNGIGGKLLGLLLLVIAGMSIASILLLVAGVTGWFD